MLRLLALILMLAPVVAAAQPVPRTVEAYMAEQRGFSGVVLVARGGDVFKRAYGMADREWNVPNTVDTHFRIGSLTKQFTAAAILILADRGKLRIDDPVCNFIDDCPASWAPMRVRHLLNHSSGIPDPISGARMVQPARLADTVAALKALPLDFAPGSKASYGNSALVVAAHLIERVSGQPYADFLDSAIYQPLGLADTGYEVGARILPKRARGYTSIDGGFANAGYVDMTVTIGAGSQYSTALDLYKWDRALAGNALLSEAAKREMFTQGQGGFGLGWQIGDENGRRVFQHSGDINGFAAFIARYPDDDAAIVILSNTERTQVRDIKDAIAELLFAKP